jgi:hypothetical protein
MEKEQHHMNKKEEKHLELLSIALNELMKEAI